ncbi:mediator of RNA polymerase II transcription subunit 8 [Silene latifolia]|uniref:mediator of RNA polymerase II transcription subunit 8 n=1 Tax=Silene latifolia TaxID=37657 RepID=UPI003D77F220
MDAQQQPPSQQPPQPAAERLNPAVQQQLNLQSVKLRAESLQKLITRMIEDMEFLSRSNALPKWQDSLSQFSMVNLELHNISEDIKKVSKAFVVYPRNVNAENANILPVMLSSKLLPEMEADDNVKKAQLLLGLQNLPVTAQIEKLKARIDMIAEACESAGKVLADTRKAYCLDTKQKPSTVPTVDKAHSATILEQENILRAAVNSGEGLKLPADQRHLTSPLPAHLAGVLTVGDGAQTFGDGSGMYSKNTPPMSSGNHSNQGPQMQASGGQPVGRSVPSPSAATAASSFDNTASPLLYANSPRSGANIMNAPSPQQQNMHPQQQLQQPRSKIMPNMGMNAPSAQQLIAQQYRLQGMGQLPGLNQMQFSQPITSQQFQGRQLATGHLQHGIAQSQLSQGSQLNRHMGQYSGTANTALFNAAQSSPNPSMISNMSAAMASQSLLPRMQFPSAGGNPQRTHQSQMLSDQIFNMGANPGSMMSLPQQQVHQGAFGNQTLQSNMVPMQNTTQNLQNFQQRQQNQQ